MKSDRDVDEIIKIFVTLPYEAKCEFMAYLRERLKAIREKGA